MIDKTTQRAIDAAVSEYRDELLWFPKAVESPIERAMYVAFAHLEHIGRTLSMSEMPFSYMPHLPVKSCDDRCAWVYVQEAIGPYRVDFLIVVRASHAGELFERHIVVECDGHDFHEKTKAQVSRDKARDRFFAARGMLVMRFSGADIYRDALECACEVSACVAELVQEWIGQVTDKIHDEAVAAGIIRGPRA